MPRAGFSPKDWRPPCTKSQDPEAYKRIGEIVETIILNGENPTKKTFREIDPELWDRFKETSIRNTINTWKKKILSTHKEEGIGGVKDTSEDNQAEEEDIWGDQGKNNKTEDEEEQVDSDYDYNEEEDVSIDSPVKESPAFVESKEIKFASPATNNTKMPRYKMQNQEDSGIIMTHDIVNIPGNPGRVFMRIVEREDSRRYLRMQICANAGPMKDVMHNFKLEVHQDGHGCDIVLPISPTFFFVENATMLGYKNETKGDICGPIEHFNALKSRFGNEDNLYEAVETFSVSFGPLKVRKRLFDPKVRTKIMCPTFIVYLEIIEENMRRKEKITLDDDEEEEILPKGFEANRSPYYDQPTTTNRASSNFIPRRGASTSAPPPHQDTEYTSRHDSSASAPRRYGGQAAPNNHNAGVQHQGSSYNHQVPNPMSSGAASHHRTAVSTPPTVMFSPTINEIDPSILEYLKNLSFQAAGEHQQNTPQTESTTHATASHTPTTSSSTVNMVARQANLTTPSYNRRDKFKRGATHRDVAESRDEASQWRREMNNLLSRGLLHVETSTEGAEVSGGVEEFLSPSSQAGSAGGAVTP